MKQDVLDKIEELKGEFLGVCHQDEKELLEAVMLHAISDQTSTIDSLLSNDFAVRNSGYTYKKLEEWRSLLDNDNELSIEAIKSVFQLHTAWSKYNQSKPSHSDKPHRSLQDSKFVRRLPHHLADSYLSSGISILYATRRHLDSVWTASYVLISGGALLVSYGDKVRDGYRYERSLPNLEVIESPARNVTHIKVNGTLIRVMNPKHVMDYNCNLNAPSEMEWEARRLLKLYVQEDGLCLVK